MTIIRKYEWVGAKNMQYVKDALLKSKEKNEATWKVLDKFSYDGDDLGAVYSKAETTFKVWAPTAQMVKLRLYSVGSREGQRRQLHRLPNHEL